MMKELNKFHSTIAFPGTTLVVSQWLNFISYCKLDADLRCSSLSHWV